MLLSAAEFAASYLPSQMAGVGVLALPKAMVGTGPAGFALIVYFTVNAMFAGSRLGMCWVMVTERYPEYLDGVGVTCHSCDVSRGTKCYICSAGPPTWSSRTKPRGWWAGEYHSLSRVTRVTCHVQPRDGGVRDADAVRQLDRDHGPHGRLHQQHRHLLRPQHRPHVSKAE